MKNLRSNNSRALRMKNAKFSGYRFHMNTKMLGDFQICNSVPLINYLKTNFIAKIWATWTLFQMIKIHKFLYFSVSKYSLTLSWWRTLSYRNQFIDLLRQLMDWFLYDNSLRHERVNPGWEMVFRFAYAARFWGIKLETKNDVEHLTNNL